MCDWCRVNTLVPISWCGSASAQRTRAPSVLYKGLLLLVCCKPGPPLSCIVIKKTKNKAMTDDYGDGDEDGNGDDDTDHGNGLRCW